MRENCNTWAGTPQSACYNCHAKGHTVNECPKLDEAGKDKFRAAFKSAHKAKRERVTAHAAVAEIPAPAPTPAPAATASVASVSEKSEEFEQFQRYMELLKASDNLSLGFAQVGEVCDKKVSFASVQYKPGKRFTLDP